MQGYTWKGGQKIKANAPLGVCIGYLVVAYAPFDQVTTGLARIRKNPAKNYPWTFVGLNQTMQTSKGDPSGCPSFTAERRYP